MDKANQRPAWAGVPDRDLIREVDDLIKQAQDLVLDLEIYAKEAENRRADYLAKAAHLREILGKDAPKTRLQARPPQKQATTRHRKASTMKKAKARPKDPSPRKATPAAKQETQETTSLTEASNPKKAGHGRQKRPPIPGNPQDRKMILDFLMDPTSTVWWHSQELADALRLDQWEVLAILERWTADKILVRQYKDPFGVRFPLYAHHKRAKKDKTTGLTVAKDRRRTSGKRQALPGNPETRKKLLEIMMDLTLPTWMTLEELAQRVPISVPDLSIILDWWANDGIVDKGGHHYLTTHGGVPVTIYAYHKRVQE